MVSNREKPGAWMTAMGAWPWEEPRLALLPFGLVSILTVLPVYEAIVFLREDGPWWAFALAAIWLALVGRFLWHLDRKRLDRTDLLFLVTHTVASIATVVVVLRSSWHVA